MTWFFVAVFVLGTAWLLAQLVIGLGPGSMPLSCPRCYFGGDSNLAGVARPWYFTTRTGGVQCRSCSRYFKEHPNGSLVEDSY